MRNTESVPQKSIFSCNGYRMNNLQKNQQKNQQRSNVKPNSNQCKSKDPEVLFLNRNIFKSPRNSSLKECSTQTSKTIIQLAQNEITGFQLTTKNKESSTNFHLVKHQSETKDQSPKGPVYGISGDQNLPRNQVFPTSLVPNNVGTSNIAQNTLGSWRAPQNFSLCNYNVSKVQARSLLTKNAPVPTENGPFPRMTITGSRSGSPVRIGFQIEILNDKSDELETGGMSPDSLGETPRNTLKNTSMEENCPYSVASRLSAFTLEGSCHEQDCIFNSDAKTVLDKPLTQTFLEKTQTKPLDVKGFKSRSFIDTTYQHPNYIQDSAENRTSRVVRTIPRTNRKSSKSLDLPDNSFDRARLSAVYCQNSNFMCPTTASRIKSQMEEIQSANCLIPQMRRGRSTSPKPTTDKRRFESSKKIPYIDQSKSDISSSTTLINVIRHPRLLKMQKLEVSKSDGSVKFSEDQDVLSLITSLEASSSSFNDTTILIALNKLQEEDWRVALRGLADVVDICRIADPELIYDYMGHVNQRLIQLLKSPRSHVARIACQAAGHLFEYVKDTRRPTFDSIVDLLLYKTADANKFIRNDANLALDCMVTHISTFNAVRALCAKGPFHKNSLVRSATARLLVCAVVLAGTDVIMNPANNECTRKRIVNTMARFLEDKNLETRKLAERLYKVLSKDARFFIYLKKYLETVQIQKIQNNLRLIHKK